MRNLIKSLGDRSLSYATEPALADPAINDTKPAPKFPPSTPLDIRQSPRHKCRPRRTPSAEEVLNHYLKRVDPQIAASFTPEQREALKTMLGARGVAKHYVEIRRSLSLGRKRFYTVLLIGKEQRALHRLKREGAVSRPFNLAVRVALVALLCVPALGVFLALAR